MFEIRAKSWSESTHRFLKQCVSAGNAEACFTLGMVNIFIFKLFNNNVIKKKIDYILTIPFFSFGESRSDFTASRTEEAARR